MMYMRKKGGKRKKTGGGRMFWEMDVSTDRLMLMGVSKRGKERGSNQRGRENKGGKAWKPPKIKERWGKFLMGREREQSQEDIREKKYICLFVWLKTPVCFVVERVRIGVSGPLLFLWRPFNRRGSLKFRAIWQREERGERGRQRERLLPIVHYIQRERERESCQ